METGSLTPRHGRFPLGSPGNDEFDRHGLPIPCCRTGWQNTIGRHDDFLRLASPTAASPDPPAASGKLGTEHG
jgi:hypothetical protein